MHGPSYKKVYFQFRYALSTNINPYKVHPITGHQEPRGAVELLLHSFSTSALGGGEWSATRPGRFTPRRDPVPIVQEAGWAPGPVWTCAKNLAPTGIRSPECPARSSVVNIYKG
jgi:hypothetical protein